VPSLHRAVPLAEVDRGPPSVGEHLHLEVAGAGDEPLQEEPVVAERRRGLAPRGADGGGHFGGVSGDFHPFASAAEDGFDEYGKAHALGFGAEAEGERREGERERGREERGRRERGF